jgi:regulator of protease activity HflC (stomatin/prohibitin superfamily)
VDYILHIEVSEDGEPIATLEEFHDYLGEQRARKAEAARVRKATKEAKLAAEAKAKADREATEAERQADIAHFNEMVASAESQVAMVEALPPPGSMVEHQEARNAYSSAERMVHATAAFALTKGIEEPATMRTLRAKLGPQKVRVGG